METRHLLTLLVLAGCTGCGGRGRASGEAAPGEGPGEPHERLATAVARSSGPFSPAAPPVTDRSGTTVARFRSLSPHGMTWEHTVCVRIPPEGGPVPRGVVFAYTWGECGPDSLPPETPGACSAVLASRPTDPLRPDLHESGLVAHTLRESLRTGDVTRALPLQMVRHVTEAMSVVTALLGPSVSADRFVLVGSSKRAWAVWLAAAVDDRVAGIAPMAFDMFDVPSRLAAQRGTFGPDYSPRIGEFRDVLADPRLGPLVALVDPASYAYRYSMPVLAVFGTEDPYWALAGSADFVKSLPGGASLRYVPGAGHDVGQRAESRASVSGWAESVVAGDRVPRSRTPGAAPAGGTPPRRVETLLGVASDGRFLDTTWRTAGEGEAGGADVGAHVLRLRTFTFSTRSGRPFVLTDAPSEERDVSPSPDAG